MRQLPMLDSFDRRITYLRISLTDKCNLRCVYCMPAGGVPKRDHGEFLRFEQITEIVRVGARLGLSKVRLTGGEPLVKRGICDLVAMVRPVEGLKHLAMTTNGVLLERFAPGLRRAGLDSLNVSLDTLDPERYRCLTRTGDLRFVLRGIDAALAEGFPVKINMVVLEDTKGEEIEAMRAFCDKMGLKLQLINHFSLHTQKRDNMPFDRPPRCESCNRIRLMADGNLKPCLHSDHEVPVNFSDIEASIREAVAFKPRQGAVCTNRRMIEIGG